MWRVWKWKENRTKIDLLEQKFESQIFSNFPAYDFEFSWKVRVTTSNQNKLLFKRVRTLQTIWQNIPGFQKSTGTFFSKQKTWNLMINLREKIFSLNHMVHSNIFQLHGELLYWTRNKFIANYSVTPEERLKLADIVSCWFY